MESNAFCSGGFGLELVTMIDVSLAFRRIEETERHGVLPL